MIEQDEMQEREDLQAWIRHGRIGTGRGYQQEVERAKKIEAERNERVVPCEACQSEGRILTSDGGPDDTDHGQCPHCDGTGAEIIDTQPVELADFECENCLGMPEHGCYCKAVGAVGPGGPLSKCYCHVLPNGYGKCPECRASTVPNGEH